MHTVLIIGIGHGVAAHVGGALGDEGVAVVGGTDGGGVHRRAEHRLGGLHLSCRFGRACLVVFVGVGHALGRGARLDIVEVVVGIAELSALGRNGREQIVRRAVLEGGFLVGVGGGGDDVAVVVVGKALPEVIGVEERAVNTNSKKRRSMIDAFCGWLYCCGNSFCKHRQ